MAAPIPLVSAGVGLPVRDDPRRRIRPLRVTGAFVADPGREPVLGEVRPVLRVVAAMAAMALARHVAIVIALLAMVRMV